MHLTPDDEIFLKVNGIKNDFPKPIPFSHRTGSLDLSSALGKIIWRSDDRRRHLGMRVNRGSGRIISWDGFLFD